jgi:hypothetical protein
VNRAAKKKRLLLTAKKAADHGYLTKNGTGTYPGLPQVHFTAEACNLPVLPDMFSLRAGSD